MLSDSADLVLTGKNENIGESNKTKSHFLHDPDFWQQRASFALQKAVNLEAVKFLMAGPTAVTN